MSMRSWGVPGALVPGSSDLIDTGYKLHFARETAAPHSCKGEELCFARNVHPKKGRGGAVAHDLQSGAVTTIGLISHSFASRHRAE